MKTKFLMFIMAIGMLLAAPGLTYAQYTDEDLDFLGSEPGDSTFGPVSLEPTIIEGVFSQTNSTISLDFLFDLGTVTVYIVDEKGIQYISEEINTTEEKTATIDIKSLPAGEYVILCYTAEGLQKAYFEIR